MSLDTLRQSDERLAGLNDAEIRYVMKSRDQRLADLNDAEIDYVVTKGYTPKWLGEVSAQPKQGVPDRTWGEMAKDTTLSLGQSGLNFAKGIYGIGAVANIPGASKVVEGLNYAGNEIEKHKSDKMKAQSAGLESIDNGDGFINNIKDFGQASAYLAKNPALLADLSVQSIHALAGGAVTSLATKGSALAIAGYSGVMEGGAGFAETFQRVLDMPQEEIEQSKQYQSLIKENYTQEEARRQVAERAGQVAGAMSAATGAATGYVGSKLEIDLFKATTGQAVTGKNALGGIALQVGEEALQGGFNQFNSNVGVNTQVDENQSLSEGIGKASATEMMAGVGPAAGMGAISYGLGKMAGAKQDKQGNIDLMGTPDRGSILEKKQEDIQNSKQEVDQIIDRTNQQGNLMAGMGMDPNGQMTDQEILSQPYVTNEDGSMEIAPEQAPAPTVPGYGLNFDGNIGSQFQPTNDYGQAGNVDYGYPLMQPEAVGVQQDQVTQEPVMPPAATAPTVQGAVADLPVLELPVLNLKLSEDVPQFKEGADEKGIVQPLEGKFDRRGLSPIQVWERLDGTLEVISGRHRLDLAQRNDEQTIPGQIHREADGFSAIDAASLDAELNIRDNQGSVKDYVQYFRSTGISEEEAKLQGLLRGASTGQRAYGIAANGTEETIAAHSAGIISDEAASRIAQAAPGNDKLQLIGLKLLQDGKPIHNAENVMHAVATTSSRQGQAENLDLFGQDDAYMQDVLNMAELASQKQNAIRKEVRAAKNAAANPEDAAKSGVKVENVEQTQNRLRELSEQEQAWSEWHKHPNLVQQLQSEIGMESKSVEVAPEDDVLQPYSQQDLEQQANQQSMFDQAEAQAIKQDQIQSTADNFNLTGSDTYLDQAAAQGQSDMIGMFDEGEANAAPKPTPQTTQETETQAQVVSQSPVTDKPASVAKTEENATQKPVQNNGNENSYSYLTKKINDDGTITSTRYARDGSVVEVVTHNNAEDSFEYSRKVLKEINNGPVSVAKTEENATQKKKRNQVRANSVFQTKSGRETTVSPGMAVKNGMVDKKPWNNWLFENAEAEARQNGDEVAANRFNNMWADRATSSDVQAAAQYLFDRPNWTDIGDLVVEGKDSIKLSKSGKPFSSEKTARLSQTFKETPNAEIVPVNGGFGVREGMTQEKPTIAKTETVSKSKPDQETKPNESNSIADATLIGEGTKSKPDQEVDLETPEIISHLTKKGKELRGFIVYGSKENAQNLDEYTFKKGNGWFVREQHLDKFMNLDDDFGQPVKSNNAAVNDKPVSEMDSLKAEMGQALDELVSILGGKKNMLPEDEAAILPVMGKIFTIASKMGYTKFKDAAKFVMDQLRNISTDTANKIELKNIQAGYINAGGDIMDAATVKSMKELVNSDNAPRSLKELIGENVDNIKNNNDLKKLIAEADQVKVSDVKDSDLKEAQEFLELELVKKAKRIIQGSTDSKQAYEALVDLYKNQPKLNIRSTTSIKNQAYSTPAPIAYLASNLAGISENSTVYEPTAGNGMLLIGANTKNSVVNELNDVRVSQLKEQGYKVTQEDATTYLPSKKVDAVIMNPPFEKFPVTDIDGYKFRKLDHVITARALEAMKQDGKATIIIGASMQPGEISGSERVFFNWLYSNYNVTDHFEVDGKLYARQGAQWPIRVIMVNGRIKSNELSPKDGSIDRVNNWEELYERYNEALAAANERSFTNRTNDLAGSEIKASDTNSIAASILGTAQGEAGGNERGGNTRQPNGVRPTRNNGGSDKGDNTQGNDGSTGGLGNNTDAVKPGRPIKTAGNSDKKSERGNIGGNGRGDVDRNPVTNGKQSNAVEASDFQTSYTTYSGGSNEAVLTPSGMATATNQALSRISKEVGGIDNYVMEKLGYDSLDDLHKSFMGLQVDTVAAAIYNHEKMNKAIIIADQTGVGKGRQAAAIIRYAHRQGKVPVFITVSPNLFTDMYDDLADIGSHDIRPFITNDSSDKSGGFVLNNGKKLFAVPSSQKKAMIGDVVANGSLTDDYNAVFMTYSQINTANDKRRMLAALGDNVFFVLDEAHNAAGEQFKVKKGFGKQPTTAGFIAELIKGKPVTYLSATYAKRPDNMPVYYRTSIADAVENISEVVDAVTNGGEVLQTIMASMLSKEGQLFRRERSFEGIQVNTVINFDNTAKQEQLSDEVTKALRSIVEADKTFHDIFVSAKNDEVQSEGADVRGGGNKAAAGVDHVNFTSIVHNRINDLLTAAKIDDAINEAIKSHKRGEKVIIALDKTGGSFIDQYISDNGLSKGDVIDVDYRELLLRNLERTRKVVIKDSQGNEQIYVVPESALDPITKDAYDRARDVINSVDVKDIPISPIDHVISKLQSAGIRVGEITGRETILDYSSGQPVISSRQKETRKTVDQFNNGQIDALVINRSGSTGLSVHASEKFKDQSVRHMIVVEPNPDINVFMQMLGRINRTGQVVKPKYSIMGLNIPSVKRPLASLSNKMRSLNANTSANTDSDTSIDSPEMLNKYGDQIFAAYLQENILLAIKLDISSDQYGDKGMPGLALKVTGRMALLPIEDQKQIYNDIEPAYKDYIEYLDKVGKNDLKPTTMNLDAKIVDSKVVYEGKAPGTVFGSDTLMHEVDVKYQGNPPTSKDIIEELDKVGEPTLLNQSIFNEAKADDSYIKSLTEREARAQNDIVSAKTDKQKEEASQRLLSAQEAINHYSVMERVFKNMLSTFTVGHRARLDLEGNLVTGVVVGLKYRHVKNKGNPFALGKAVVQFMVNDGIRNIDLPFSKLTGDGSIFVEKLQGKNKDGLEDIFDSTLNTDRRETRYIATGNLIMGASKLESGRIINFTDDKGDTYSGILMPKVYGKNNEFNSFGANLAVTLNGDAVAKFIADNKESIAKSHFIKSVSGDVVISPKRDGWEVTIMRSGKSNDSSLIRASTDLQSLIGDFYGSGKTMQAAFNDDVAPEAIQLLSGLVTLQAPSTLREKWVEAGGKNIAKAAASFDPLAGAEEVSSAKLAESGPKFSFAGINAATADKVRLSNAERMINEGVDAETVRKETGWFKGADGKWRFEIDDSKAKAKGFGKGTPFETVWESKYKQKGDAVTLADLISHDELFAAYPALAEMSVTPLYNEDSRGQYYPSANAISINKGLPADEVVSVLMHEIQHAIQTAERFARGGMPSEFEVLVSIEKGLINSAAKLVRKVKTDVLKQNPSLAERDWLIDQGDILNEMSDKQIMAHFEKFNKDMGVATDEYLENDSRLKYRYQQAIIRLENSGKMLTAHDRYRTLAGEVESRNVQTRMTMDAAERLLRSPESTEDIARNEQTVRFDNGNMASQSQESANEPVEITNLRTDLGRFYGVDANQVEAKADELLLPNDVRSTLEQLYGRKIIGFTGGEYASAFNGVILPGRGDAIYVASNSDQPILNIAGHEFLHALKEDSPEIYDALVMAMQPLIINTFQYGEKLNAARRQEGKADASFELIIEEIIADTLGDNFTKPEFWAKVSQQLDAKQPGLFGQLIKAVKAFLKDLHAAINPLGHDKYVNDVEAAQNAVAEATALHIKARSGNKNAQAEVASLASNLDSVMFSRRNPQTTTTSKGDLGKETKWDRLMRTQTDSFHRFQKLDEWMAKEGLLKDKNATVYKAEATYHGRVATRIEDFREKQLKPLIKAIQSSGYTLDDVEMFLHAQHAEERNIQIQKINPQIKDGSGMDTATARDILAKADNKLIKVANDYRKIADQTKQDLLKSGILSKEQVNAWDEAYQNYVPLRGSDETMTGTGKGMTPSYKVKRALGHSARDEHILENIQQAHERAIMAIEKNRVAKFLLRQAVDLGNPDIIDIGNPQKRAVLRDGKAYSVVQSDKNGGQAVVETFTNKRDAQTFIQTTVKMQNANGFKLDPGSLQIQVSSDPAVIYTARPTLEDNETIVYSNGQSVRIQLNDDLLAQAYKNMGVEKLNDIMRAGQTLNNYLSRVYTAYAPEFIFVNMIRDFFTGIPNIAGEKGAKFAAKSVKNYAKAAKLLSQYHYLGKDNPIIQSYRDEGGTTGAAYLSDLERLGDDAKDAFDTYAGFMENMKKGNKLKATRLAGKQAFVKSLAWLENANAVAENAFRLAVYMSALDEGMSKIEAANLAKNVTVNFNRKGEIGRQINALYLFHNAAVQGSSIIAKALFKSENKGQVQALTAGLVGLGVMSSLLMGGADDEEWEKLPEHVKERNWAIRTAEGWATIPIPYGYGFFTTLGRTMGEVGLGKMDIDKASIYVAHALLNETLVFGSVYNPENPTIESITFAAPTAVQIPFAPIMNLSGLGTPIRPESWSSATPNSELMWRNTDGTSWSGISRGINSLTGGSKIEGGWISISPETLKYYWNTFTGGLGRSVTDGANAGWLMLNDADPELREVPIVRKFVRTDNVSESRRRFQEYKKEVKLATDQLARAKSLRDGALMQSVDAEKRELLALGKLSNRYQTAANQLRDQQLEIKTDENLTIAERRLKLKQLEIDEARLYDDFVATYKNYTGRVRPKVKPE